MEAKKEIEARKTIAPACSISEDSGVVTVTLEMPGVPKEGFEVKIEGNELSVSGEKKIGEARGRYILRERRSGSYRKVFTLDDTISRDKVDAGLADGILTIKLEVKEAAKPRRIEIA
jgi:HSP20 family protein